MKKTLIAVLALFFLASCGGKQPKKDTVYLAELKAQRPLQAEQQNQNRAAMLNYKKKKIILTRIAAEDRQEQGKLLKKQEEIVRRSEALKQQLLKKIGIDSAVVARGNKKVEALLNSGLSTEELERRLRSETQLSDAEINKIIKGYRLKQLIASSQTKEQLETVLRENTDLDDSEIQEVVKIQQQIIDKREELKVETLRKIHTRLVRNRRLNIDTVFCAAASKLDQIVIRPVYYPFDIHITNKKSSNLLFDDFVLVQKEIKKYPDMLLQLEGNCDYKGSNRYNKALGDRRWSGVEPLLTSMGINKNIIRGISKGEECPTGEKDDDEIWRGENRRTDFVWTLK